VQRILRVSACPWQRTRRATATRPRVRLQRILRISAYPRKRTHRATAARPRVHVQSILRISACPRKRTHRATVALPRVHVQRILRVSACPWQRTRRATTARPTPATRPTINCGAHCHTTAHSGRVPHGRVSHRIAARRRVCPVTRQRATSEHRRRSVAASLAPGRTHRAAAQRARALRIASTESSFHRSRPAHPARKAR